MDGANFEGGILAARGGRGDRFLLRRRVVRVSSISRG